MIANSIRYRFSQNFHVPASEAFAWCVDYQPEDLALIGEKTKRKVLWLSSSVVVLDDKYSEGVRKKKLVNIYSDRKFWISTHISGPYKFSQFLYQIVGIGKKSSRLDFTGFQVVYGKRMGAQEISRLANKLRIEDSLTWKNFAKAMEMDVGT
jgi:hypothetical protein